MGKCAATQMTDQLPGPAGSAPLGLNGLQDFGGVHHGGAATTLLTRGRRLRQLGRPLAWRARDYLYTHLARRVRPHQREENL